MLLGRLLLPLDGPNDVFFVAELRADSLMIEVVVAGDAHLVLVPVYPTRTEHVIFLSGRCRLQFLVHYIVILAQLEQTLLVLGNQGVAWGRHP